MTPFTANLIASSILLLGEFFTPLAHAACDTSSVKGVYQYGETVESADGIENVRGHFIFNGTGGMSYKAVSVKNGKRRLFEYASTYKVGANCTLSIFEMRHIEFQIEGKELYWEHSNRGSTVTGRARRTQALDKRSHDAVETALLFKINLGAEATKAQQEIAAYGQSCTSAGLGGYACNRYNEAMSVLSRACSYDGDYCQIYASIVNAQGWSELRK